MITKTYAVTAMLCLSIVTAAAPCLAGIVVVGALTHEAELTPGGMTQGRIMVRNDSEHPQQVKVYQNDYLFHADGTNLYGDPGSVARSNAAWISFSPRLMTIQAGETVPVHYALRVPSDPSLRGTYWSLLMVEPIPDGTLDPEGPKNKSMAVATILRYAVQMVTHIGNTGACESTIIDKRLVTDNGASALFVDIENTGERWLRPLVWLEVYDDRGAPRGRIEGQQLRIYPGCSVRFQIDLTTLPSGDYTGLLIADNGDEHVFGARYGFSIK